jgi:hypothetical protein
MKAEIYATDRFWSEVPLNGAAPVRLSRTDVAAHLHKIETFDSNGAVAYGYPHNFPTLQQQICHI